MDKARQKTDRLLNDLERRIAKVYAEDPSLRRIQKKYNAYMDRVDRLTHDAYLAYKNADNTNSQDELKKVYMEQLRSLTLDNKQFKSLTNEITRIMADVNQSALDLVNAEMSEIYTINYNQVSSECRKVGIKVDG